MKPKMKSIDLDTAEVVFAQKLASGEPRIRLKAMNRLKKWISTRISKEMWFTSEDLLKLWKGLYYCMWMQDKPLIQEELADNISGLLTLFKTEEQRFLYLDAFVTTLGREWNGLDQWRMNKFFMLLRRFVRAWLSWLKSERWDPGLMQRSFSLWRQTFWNTTGVYPESLKFHFASLYLDELDAAAGNEVEADLVTQMLMPYIEMVKDKHISDNYFSEIMKEIFETIVLQYSEELNSRMESDDTETVTPAGITFDYHQIGRKLFEAGKSPSVGGERRKTIYAMVKKFEAAANGTDPFEEAMSDGEDLSKTELQMAAQRLVRARAAIGAENRKRKKHRKEVHKMEVSDSDESPKKRKKSRRIA